MAAKFGFKITADDETKRDVNSAEKGLERLGKAGDRTGKLLKAAFAGFSLAAITKGINAAVDAFGDQEKAELRLIAAAKNNPYINGDAVRGIRDYAAGLQDIGVFGDELIIQQGAILTTLQLTEDQITGVLDAAVDLASTGMVSLESAVRNISKTYSGMTGELGELIPALRELTAEELKAGGAVDLISEAYAGMAEAAAAGISGTKEQIKNLWGDMQEGLGSAIAPIFKSILERLRPIIQTLIDWFNEHANQITNFFIQFPSIAGAAFGLVKDMIADTFTLDFAANAFKSFSEYITNQFKSVFAFLGTVVAAIGISIWEPLKTGFEWIAYGIKAAFQAVATALFNVFDTIVIGPINAVIEGLEAIVNASKHAGAALAAFFKHPFSKERRQAAFQEAIANQVPTDFGGINIRAPQFRDLQKPDYEPEKIADAWAKVIEGVPAYASRTWTNVANLATDIGGHFDGLIDGFTESIDEILSRELDDKVKSPILALEESLDDQKEGETGPGGVTLPEQWAGPTGLPDIFEGVREGSKELDIIFEQFGAEIMSVMGVFSSVQAIMNPLATILQGFANTIQGPLNRALAPLIGVFVTIGSLLGNILTPIINQMAPILEKLAEIFVWLHNKIFKPIGEGLIFILTVLTNAIKVVANGFIAIVRGVVSLLNEIPGVNIKKPKYLEIVDPKAAAHIEEISLDTLTNAGNDYTGGMEAGSGASITGGHDVTINFQINTDVLLGDRRELAEWVAEEIRDAIELGEVVA